jgi:hypothetical protein
MVAGRAVEVVRGVGGSAVWSIMAVVSLSVGGRWG